MNKALTILSILSAAGLLALAVKRPRKQEEDAPCGCAHAEAAEGESNESSYVPPMASKPLVGHRKAPIKRHRAARIRVQRPKATRVKTRQVTVRNVGSAPREVRLWGGNFNAVVSPTLPGEATPLQLAASLGQSTAQFNHPQAALLNPVNGLLYIANQLSDTVEVMGADGQPVATVELGGTGLGTASPVGLAADPSSGMVFVANSIANTVSLIDGAHTVVAEVGVGQLPVACALHPVTGQLYVANYGSNDVSVVNLLSAQEVARLPVGNGPRALAVDPSSGEIWVANKQADSVSVIAPNHATTDTVGGLTGAPSSLAFHPDNGAAYVTAQEGDALYKIDPQSRTVLRTIPTGDAPSGVAFNAENSLLYVANDADDTLTLLDDQDAVVDTLAAPGLGGSFAFNVTTGDLFVPDVDGNTVNVYQPSGASGQVEVDDEYAHVVEEFKYDPAYVHHIKWVQVGLQPVRLVELSDRSATGKSEVRHWHLNNYDSPQHGIRVAEMFESRGTVIDGQHQWRFTLPAGQSITILLTYSQRQRKELLSNALKRSA